MGLDVRRVQVEADIGRGGDVKFFLVGLAATTVKEARERVRSAIRNSDLEFPHTRLTANLAPAELRKEGTGLDLPIAVAIALARAQKQAPPRSAFLGELALDGTVRHVDGVLVAARGLCKLGYERIFVPAEDAAEAALIDGTKDRKSTRLNSSHQIISYAVFCLKKKKKTQDRVIQTNNG